MCPHLQASSLCCRAPTSLQACRKSSGTLLSSPRTPSQHRLLSAGTQRCQNDSKKMAITAKLLTQAGVDGGWQEVGGGLLTAGRAARGFSRRLAALGWCCGLSLRLLRGRRHRRCSPHSLLTRLWQHAGRQRRGWEGHQAWRCSRTVSWRAWHGPDTKRNISTLYSAFGGDAMSGQSPSP